MDNLQRIDDTLIFAKKVMHEVEQGEIDRSRVLVALVMLHYRLGSHMKELAERKQTIAQRYAAPKMAQRPEPIRRGNIYHLPIAGINTTIKADKTAP